MTNIRDGQCLSSLLSWQNLVWFCPCPINVLRIWKDEEINQLFRIFGPTPISMQCPNCRAQITTGWVYDEFGKFLILARKFKILSIPPPTQRVSGGNTCMSVMFPILIVPERCFSYTSWPMCWKIIDESESFWDLKIWEIWYKFCKSQNIASGGVYVSVQLKLYL